MQVTVNSTSGLMAALKAASGGDIIQLAPGTYSGMSMSNLTFDKPVTITSLDPNSQAVVNNFVLKNVNGLTFQNLEFQATGGAQAYWAFRVESSSNITFDSLDVHGTLDNNPQNDAYGISIRGSTNVTVSNSEFHELGVGITHISDDGLTITGNKFHSIRMDGIDGGGSRHVVVSENYFNDFHPLASDHPDAIQFWTTGMSRSGGDITITNNVIVRGDGAAMQGVFIQDEEHDKPYYDVTVSGNLFVGTSYNGISVGHADGVSITDNQVVSLPDQPSWIHLVNITDGVLTGNQAVSFSTSSAGDLSQDDNSVIAVAQDGGVSVLKTWLANHAADDLSIPGARAVGDAKSLAATLAARSAVVVTTDGTDGADVLRVDGFHDTVLRAGAGNDVLVGGGSAHNTLIGGVGDDTYRVNSSTDVVVEGAGGGTDTVLATVDTVLSDNVENLRLLTGATTGTGNALNNWIVGSDASSTLSGLGGNDAIQGGAGDDRILGGDGADNLSGNDGADTITGDAGDDRLYGGGGADSLSGGLGADTIDGGLGADTLSGGAGADTFVFREVLGKQGGAEHILDFSHAAGDRISLTAIDANTLTSANDTFSFIGTDAFHHKAGELRYDVQPGGLYLQGDTDGDGVADLRIILDGVTSLNSNDIWL